MEVYNMDNALEVSRRVKHGLDINTGEPLSYADACTQAFRQRALQEQKRDARATEWLKQFDALVTVPIEQGWSTGDPVLVA